METIGPREQRSVADRKEVAAILRDIAERYERGDPFGAILVAEVSERGVCCYAGTHDDLEPEILNLFYGELHRALGGVAEQHRAAEQDGGEAGDALRTTRGGSA